MTNDNLTLIFEGSGVEKGEIDVQDLAPALLAIGDLIQVVNRTVNGNAAKMSVSVKATAEGSFEVELSLFQSLLDHGKSLLDFVAHNKDGISGAKDLADLIFKVSAAGLSAGGGLFALLKCLKGKKPDSIEEKGGQVVVNIGEINFVTNRQTVQLAENLEVREQARKALASLNKEGINRISVRRPDRETLRVDKSELHYFDVPAIEEELADEVRVMTLQIISLSFKEDNKWKVSDGSEPFNVTIEDADFLNQIAKGELAFSKNDYLVCEVRERQFQTSKGLRKERSIIAVKQHKPGYRQLKLL